MSLFSKLRGEFVDVIEWTDDSNDTMVYRFERYGNEIKYGAQLTVRQAQVAVFVNEGQLADIFEPGMFTLETQNVPILSTLQGWKHGFESPFKAEVYFISTRRFTDLKWGTKNPIIMRDREFGTVRIRAFGTYAIRVADPIAFLREIVGTDGHFTTDEITDQLRNMIVSRMAGIVASSGIPLLDMAASYDNFGEFLRERIQPEFDQYGLEITKLLVENISLPPEVEAALDKRTSMGIVGDLNQYTQYQTAEAIGDAANNPGAAGQGVGLGLGIAMANTMGGAMAGQQQPHQQAPQPAAPPPLPTETEYFVAIGGQQAGPFKASVVAEKIRGGEVDRSTLVWTQGMANWAAAGDVEDLKPAFGAVPPPLPPAG